MTSLTFLTGVLNDGLTGVLDKHAWLHAEKRFTIGLDTPWNQDTSSVRKRVKRLERRWITYIPL